MAFDFNKMTIAEKIKKITAYRGMQIAQLGSEFNRRFGTKYSAQSFRNKLNNGALSFNDVEKIGEILNFKIELISTD